VLTVHTAQHFLPSKICIHVYQHKFVSFVCKLKGNNFYFELVLDLIKIFFAKSNFSKQPCLKTRYSGTTFTPIHTVHTHYQKTLLTYLTPLCQDSSTKYDCHKRYLSKRIQKLTGCSSFDSHRIKPYNYRTTVRSFITDAYISIKSQCVRCWRNLRCYL